MAGFDKSKVECFNCHKMVYFARECRAPKSQDRGRRDNFRQGSKAEEQAPKALMAIDRVGWDWSYIEKNEEDHALVADEVTPTEFASMANTSAESKVFDNSLCSKDCKKNNDSLNSKITYLTDKLFDANNFIYHYKLALAQVESRLVEYKEREVKYIEKIKTLEFYNESYKECIETLKKKLESLQQEMEGVDRKLACLLTASKDLDNLIKSQRSHKNKEGLGYTTVPSPPAQLYLSPKKDLSRTGLPECADDIVTDYSRPSPTIESTSEDDQNKNPSIFETIASPITPKPFIKFMKPKYSQSESKTEKKETPKKPPVKKRVKQNLTPRPVAHKPYRPSQRLVRTNMNDARQTKHFSINRKLSTSSRNFPTAKRKFHSTSRKFPTGSTKSITADMGIKGKAVKPSACWFWKPSQNQSNKVPRTKLMTKAIGTVAALGGCKITGKGTIKTGKLEFENVYFVKDLKFTWTFFLTTKDETSCILKKFISEIENLKDLKVKIIRCDNGGEFRNKEMNDFCSQKGIKREFSNARTPQQNGVAERRSRTLIEAARTMLADAKLPVTFWAEAANTACYV
nr:putative ribonuclease H-like domain-containing protein [Tanacetum cinerariifolium]